MSALNASRSSFLCPNGTIFNQERLICDWWSVISHHHHYCFWSAPKLTSRIILISLTEINRWASCWRQLSIGNDQWNGVKIRVTDGSKGELQETRFWQNCTNVILYQCSASIAWASGWRTSKLPGEVIGSDGQIVWVTVNDQWQRKGVKMSDTQKSKSVTCKTSDEWHARQPLEAAFDGWVVRRVAAHLVSLCRLWKHSAPNLLLALVVFSLHFCLCHLCSPDKNSLCGEKRWTLERILEWFKLFQPIIQFSFLSHKTFLDNSNREGLDSPLHPSIVAHWWIWQKKCVNPTPRQLTTKIVN